jgi:hypothetical protein
MAQSHPHIFGLSGISHNRRGPVAGGGDVIRKSGVPVKNALFDSDMQSHAKPFQMDKVNLARLSDVVKGILQVSAKLFQTHLPLFHWEAGITERMENRDLLKTAFFSASAADTAVTVMVSSSSLLV